MSTKFEFGNLAQQPLPKSIKETGSLRTVLCVSRKKDVLTIWSFTICRVWLNRGIITLGEENQTQDTWDGRMCSSMSEIDQRVISRKKPLEQAQCWNASLECRDTEAIFSLYSDKIRPLWGHVSNSRTFNWEGQADLDRLQRKFVRMTERLENNTCSGRLKDTGLAPTSRATSDESLQLVGAPFPLL